MRSSRELSLRLNPKAWIALPFLLVFAWTGGTALGQTAKGKISRNFYRVPYATGSDTRMDHDYVLHDPSGRMDMSGTDDNPDIVAAADGEVIFIDDSSNDCGCHDNFGGSCANEIRIRHANGEVSIYTHLRQNSATALGITDGMNVSAGDALGTEGDVGRTCGDTSPPRIGTCVASIPPGTGDCGQHLHWGVHRESTLERVNPMTCNIPGNLYVDNDVYTAVACNTQGCPTNQNLAGHSFDGFGTFRVVQAESSVTASTVTVSNSASVVFHAGRSVSLTPGFHAAADSYFRAEIGDCNTTAPGRP